MSGLERKDSGVYRVKAKNSQGEDEVEVRVNVVGPPDKPRGPLEVSDVRSTREPIQRCCDASESQLGGYGQMMSAKFSGSLSPSPLPEIWTNQ